MSEAFLLQYNDVVISEADDHNKVKGKYPFHQSTWKDAYIKHMNMQESYGDLLRSTFLTGGSLHMSHSMYQKSFAFKTSDIENGCILTDAEVAHNCEGVRLFFDLDYSTSKHPLPSFEEALMHLRLLYRTVHDCFPHLESLVMHIATCTPKRKHRKSSSSVDLAWGIHVIFPTVIVTTPIIRLIAQLLDTRISNTFPRWNSIVDPTCYSSSSATLRPCFSYKLVECPICNIGKTSSSASGAQTTKRRRVDRETIIENLFRIQLSESCSCFKGHKVDPSIYTYIGSLTEVDGPVTQVIRGGLQAILTETSITPSQMGTFTNGFCRPVDMGDGHDAIPRSDTLESHRAVSAFQCRKNSLSLELGDYPNGGQTILEIIKRINAQYSFVAIHRLSVDRKKRSFMISVKGSGSRYCMYKNGVHNSNRVYFCVDVKRARIQAHCSDPDCKREHAKDQLVERTLTLGEKFNLTTQFGLKDTQIRRTMSPITAEEVVLVPRIQMSEAEIKRQKRQQWEEKRQKYQSLIDGQ
jgi:hypothetical protein